MAVASLLPTAFFRRAFLAGCGACLGRCGNQWPRLVPELRWMPPQTIRDFCLVQPPCAERFARLFLGVSFADATCALRSRFSEAGVALGRLRSPASMRTGARNRHSSAAPNCSRSHGRSSPTTGAGCESFYLRGASNLGPASRMVHFRLPRREANELPAAWPQSSTSLPPLWYRNP